MRARALAASFPGVPPDPLAFWRALHPDPINGFFLGAPSEPKSNLYFSAGEPAAVHRCPSNGLGPLLAKLRACRGGEPRALENFSSIHEHFLERFMSSLPVWLNIP